MQNPPPIQVGGQITKSQYQFALQSPDTAELYRNSMMFMQEMAALPGLEDVTSDLLIRKSSGERQRRPRQSLRARRIGQQVENALYTAYGQRQVSTIYAPNDEYWVVMELADKYQRIPRLFRCSTFVPAPDWSR